MRQVGWKSTWKSDVIEEAQPKLSGLVPTASLSRDTNIIYHRLGASEISCTCISFLACQVCRFEDPLKKNASP